MSRDSLHESLRDRVARLEQEVADNRVLRCRVEELTDQLAEILVAIEDRDHDRVEELVAALRASA
ncbi:MAG: hypothetical protein QM572_15745 [Nocardioides sp.]|uniref:DUF6752 domain-containing protein n=1 Tax=Nocardioides sp. TaxID=35761 RepID=UPI0039E462A6